MPDQNALLPAGRLTLQELLLEELLEQAEYLYQLSAEALDELEVLAKRAVKAVEQLPYSGNQIMALDQLRTVHLSRIPCLRQTFFSRGAAAAQAEFDLLLLHLLKGLKLSVGRLSEL